MSEEYQGFSFSSEYDISWNDVADKVTVAESSCIREVLGLADEPAAGQGVFDDRTEPWEVSAWGCLSQENAAHLFEASDPYLGSPFPMERVLEISGDNSECVREALHKVDYPVLAAGGIPGTGHQKGAPFYAILTALAYCQTEALSGYENYHNDIVAFVPLPPGVRASGSVDYTGDVDVFLVQIEEGKFYQVDVLTGSLQAPLAGMQDSAFGFSDTYFKREGSDRLWPITCYSTSKTQEFPMEWRAERSGDQLVIVRGGSCDDMGTYTVSLSVSEEAEDDHGDSPENATPIAVGESASGNLGYGVDADFFSFTAVGGRTYEIVGRYESGHVLQLNVYDADGWILASRSGQDWDPVVLKLPDAGARYDIYIGAGEGATDRERRINYSLTVSPSENTDDHPWSEKYYIHIAEGDEIAASIDFSEDADFFGFTAEAGSAYEIMVAPLGTGEQLGLIVYDSDATKRLKIGVSGETGPYLLSLDTVKRADDIGNITQISAEEKGVFDRINELKELYDRYFLCVGVEPGGNYRVRVYPKGPGWGQLEISPAEQQFPASAESEHPPDQKNIEKITPASAHFCNITFDFDEETVTYLIHLAAE